MSVLSKIFTPVDATCGQFVHPWTDSCYAASAGLLLHSLQASFRLYFTVYMLALLMKGRKPTKKEVRNTFLGIIQSSAFLGCHAVGFSLFECFLRYVFGHYNFITAAYLPTFISSWFAILLERPSRRGLLSLYVTNVASETLYQMLIWRGLVRPVPYADIFIFTSSMAWLLYLYRVQYNTRDSLYSLIRFIVGSEEQLNREIESPKHETEIKRTLITKSKSSKRSSHSMLYGITTYACKTYSKFIEQLKLKGKCQYCSHSYGCVFYSLQAGLKVFAVGYGLQLSLKILMHLKRILKRPALICKSLKSADTFKLGAFIGGFSFIYRAVSCILRRFLKKDDQSIAIPAGLLAGMSFCFYRSNTIALYVMWKSLQMLYVVGLDNGVVPEVPCASIFFHCLSTALLFHAAVFEPQNLRSSYWKFLQNISGGRLAAMDRKCIDVYGLESSKMVELIQNKYGRIPIWNFNL